MLAENALIGMLAHPEGPDEAEWINYKNTPNETHRLFGKKSKDGLKFQVVWLIFLQKNI